MAKEQLTFEQFLLHKAERIRKRSESGEIARTQTSVGMTRRFRGESASDCFGYFSRNPGSVAWLGDLNEETELLANMKFLPIVKPAVRANMAAMVTARVALKVDPATKDPDLQGAAKVAEGIRDYLDGHKEHWSEVLESRIAEMSQLEFGYFIRSRHNRKKKGETIVETIFSDEELQMPGEYACSSCAKSGAFEGDFQKDVGSGLSTTRCPSCGEVAEVTEEPHMWIGPMPSGQKARNSGDSETCVVSSFNIRADGQRTQGGDLTKAHWFEHHYLEERDELEAANPDFELDAPGEWSYPLKWQFALENSELTCLQRKRWDNVDTFEVREIYLTREEYETHVEPQGSGYVLKDGVGNVMMDEEGQPVFSISPGERLIDKFPAGFRFRLTGDKILPGTPDDPGIAACDFREEWTMGGYMPDSHSLWMHPATELRKMQDDANRLYTIDMKYRERNSVRTLAADGGMFDDEDFEYDIAITKQPLDTNDDIRRHFAGVDAPNMSNAIEGLKFVLDIIPTVGGGLQQAAIGAPQPGEPYAAQLLQKQSSLGLLAPSQQSKARVKVTWFGQHLKLAQEWPRERFAYIRSRFGEEWKDEDIDAFLNCDVERALILSYVEGSEIPATLIERELRYRDFMTQLAEWAAASGQANLITPEMIAQGAEYSGVDYDIGNVEADKRLAKKRYDTICARLQKLRDRVAPEELLVAVLSHPQLRVLPKENHATHIEYYADRERALMAEDLPDVELVECLEGMILRHEKGGVEDAQNMQADQIAANAPQMAVEQMTQGAQVQNEQSQSEDERARAEAERASAAEEAERGRVHEKEMKTADVAMHVADLASQERQTALQSQA
jgi:hypothetical protein